MSDSGIINYKSQQLVLAMVFSHNITLKRGERKTYLACNYYLRIKCLQNALRVNEPLGYSCG